MSEQSGFKVRCSEDSAYALKARLTLATETVEKQRDTITRLEQKLVRSNESLKRMEDRMAQENAARADFLQDRAAAEQAFAERAAALSANETLKRELAASEDRTRSLLQEKQNIAEQFDRFSATTKAHMETLRAKAEELAAVNEERAALSHQSALQQAEIERSRTLIGEYEQRVLILTLALSESKAETEQREKFIFESKSIVLKERQDNKDALHDAQSVQKLAERERDALKIELAETSRRMQHMMTKIATLEEVAAKNQTDTFAEREKVESWMNEARAKLEQLTSQLHLEAKKRAHLESHALVSKAA